MSQKGISLIESVLALTVISSLVFLLANIPNSISLINKSKHINTAREIATKEIENKRSLGFINLVDGNTQVVDSRVTLLPSGNARVTVEDCEQQVCPNSESVKKITVSVNWNESGQSEQYKISTLISQKGL